MIPPPDIYDAAQVHVWYVGFTGDRSILLPWYARPFVCEGFRHCYAMRRLTDSQALIIENLGQGLVVHCVEHAVEACAVAAYDHGQRVVMIAAGLTPRYTPRVMSCVSVVKSLLGIHDRGIWTPRQLYRYLLKTGGIRL